MSNPFLGQPHPAQLAEPSAAPERDPVLGTQITSRGPQEPPRRVPVSSLPLVDAGDPTEMWLYQLHGGAGASTLQRLLAQYHGVDASICTNGWPYRDAATVYPTLLVARTHAVGVEAARAALTQWGSGQLPENVRLMGLLLVSDGPKVADHAALKALRGMAPAAWHIGWVEQWRHLTPNSAEHSCSVRIRMTLSAVIRALQAATWTSAASVTQ